MTHVLLRLPKRGSGSVVPALEGGALPDAWWALRQAPELPKGAIVFDDRPYKGSASIVGKAPPVLPTGDFWHLLVVDAALAKRLGPLEGVNVTETLLRDPKGKVAKGYVHLDVVARVPLDRRASRATLTNGWLEALEEARWRDGATLPALFRLLDRPQSIFAREDIAKAIQQASKGKVALGSDGATNALEFPPGWSLHEAPRVAVKGEDAFWKVFGGDAKARKAALVDPWWAYAIAACVDRAPKDDTRKAASASPIIAALYASEIDRKGHDLTRKAAHGHGLSALRYATHIDLRLEPALRKKVIAEAGHDEETLAQEERWIAELAAWTKGEAAPASPPPKPRTWKRHSAPRYAADKPVDAAIRSDIDAFVVRGLGRVALDATAAPEVVVSAVHAAIDALAKDKPRGKKAKTTAQMELGCAWGEQLHRALGWQWAALPEGIALVSPDRAHAHYPFAFVGRLLSARSNTMMLLFDMLAEGDLPKSKKGALLSLA